MYSIEYFAEKYQAYQSYELLEIIQNPSQYQSLAIQAAKMELSHRLLNSKEMDAAGQKLREKKTYKSPAQQSIEKLTKKLTATAENALDHITPAENRISVADKLKFSIALVYSLIFIVQSKSHYESFSRADFEETNYMFFLVMEAVPAMLLFISLCLFWPGKKLGWQLLILFIGSNLFSLLASIYFDLTRSNDEYFISAQNSPMMYIIMGFFYIATIITLYRPEVMCIFGIHSKKHWPWGVGFMLGMLYYLFMISL